MKSYILQKSGETELKLNKEKTISINLGKNKKLNINIDNNLEKHLEFLGNKTYKLLEIVRKFLWLGKDIELYRKLQIYYAVFIPTILYGSEIWYNNIKNKKTYVKELNSVQRKIALALTGSYKTVNNEKLLDLIKICRLNEEAEIKNIFLNINKKDRKDN